LRLEAVTVVAMAAAYWACNLGAHAARAYTHTHTYIPESL